MTSQKLRNPKFPALNHVMSSNDTRRHGTQGFVSDTVLNLEEGRMFKLVFLMDMCAEANGSSGFFTMLEFALWSDHKATSWVALE